MNKHIFISLGSNLGDKFKNLQQACAAITLQCGTIVQRSTIYETPPWGYQSFNNYLNQVVEIESALNPHELLAQLLKIETDLGRIRSGADYQDRTIDLDILFYGRQVLIDEGLEIPHPRIEHRKFILAPMAEIAEHFTHPVLQRSMGELNITCADLTNIKPIL